MRPMMLAVPALGLPFLVACDKHLDLEVQITLSVAYMQTLTYPAQFAFETDEHVGSSQTLCQASDTLYFIDLKDSAIGCAAPLEVRVAEGPWNPPETGCVLSSGNPYHVLVQNGGTEVATATAYADYTDGSCKSASDVVQISLDNQAR